MYLMAAVTSLCAVILVSGLVGLACRYRPDLWFTTDDAILCVVSPVVILLLTFGGVSLGYRLAHGGLAAVALEAWIGSAIVVALAFGLWVPLARYMRRGKRPASA